MDEVLQTKAPDEMFCHACGTVIKREAEICPKCGVRQIKDNNKMANTINIYVIIGVIVSVLFTVILGWIYFLIMASLYPDEQPLKKGRKITGILSIICLIAVLVVKLLITTGSVLSVNYMMNTFNNMMNKGGESQVAVTDSTSSYMGTRPVYAWYNLIGPVTTPTKDPNVTVTVEVQIGYDDKNGNAATASNINAYQLELRDFVRRYFSSKTQADLLPENELRLKNEIRERLNTEILDITKARQIMFTRFDVIEMK
ncbi:hypothetical protein FACS1894110_19890 [Spirochaetia bacterium]|nr:hypothetical protein FACS1894110_19890 [Spirochaetia bacterium]